MSKRQPYRFEKPPAGAKVFWTSLEAKADPEGHQQRAAAEFPDGPVDPQENGVGRRTFLGVAGAAGAMLGLEGCFLRRPEDKILPFTTQPEYLVPGNALHYATTVRSAGEPLGLLVTTFDGRPTKVEGNPQHPSSFGGTDGYAQATVLDLYDPDRAPAPADGSGDTTFAEFDKAFDAILRSSGDGAGLRVLMPPTSSPSVVRVKGELRKRFPAAKVYTYEPVGPAGKLAAAKLAYGQPVSVAVDFRRAQTVVALDSDFLQTEPGSVRANRGFADGRRLASARDGMNRLYVVEPAYTVTGAAADHRLRLRADRVGDFLKALAAELVAKHSVDLGPLASAVAGAKLDGIPEGWISAVAKDLAGSRGRSLVVAGTRQPVAVQALALALNDSLGNMGRTMALFPAVDPEQGGPLEGIRALASELSAGRVETLVILGGNPALDAPADLKFGELIGKAKNTVHVSEHRNETSAACGWKVPLAHPFEAWGDHQGSDGTISVQQPLIAPLRGGRSELEMLALMAGVKWWRGHPVVRATLRALVPDTSFEQVWTNALHLGFVRSASRRPLGRLPVQRDAVASAVQQLPAAPGDGLEVTFSPDPALYDGRHANNPWMLELPDPLSCISWDNAAILSQATAQRLGLINRDLVTISGPDGQSVDSVVWILPGQADDSVSLLLGWGRENPGRYGKGAGFNVYPLRTTRAFGFGSGFKLAKKGAGYPISQTQETHSMEGRPIAIDADLEEYRKDPTFAKMKSPTLTTLPLWKEVEYNGLKWGMTIDLTTCTGCNACLVACQSENNVATVGKEQVARGRDMYWLRLDRYFVGEDAENPQVAFQPIGCQQCEEAPCENVCPVNATSHSPDGLNDMAYNRCIGTRYCMNNCPYKVRRFNFLDFTGQVPETRRMQYNPNVSIRMRGTMEKCSYCVQRIQDAKIAARRDGRQLRDGDVRVACQQACPANAIAFGDLNDPRAKVTRAMNQDRAYKLLPGIGTQPRTTFLARIRNPNPEMKA